MNPEESQNSKPVDEWWEETPEQSSASETLADLSGDLVLETETPTPSDEPQADDVNFESPIAKTEAQEPQIEPAEQTADTGALESESEFNSLYAVAAQRVAELQETEAALK